MEYIILGIAIVFVIVASIKIGCAVHDKKKMKERRETVEDLQLICTEISYSEYIKIAKKASIRNAPIRSKGDFWDFILPFAHCSGTGKLETRLAKADCEENN